MSWMRIRLAWSFGEGQRACVRDRPEVQEANHAFSMPKLEATPTETVLLESANLLDFRGFDRVLLVCVRPEIALITRRSSFQI
jgi:hypothetical protein